MHAQPADTSAGRLHDVHVLFPRIHADLVREVKAVGCNTEPATLIACDVAVGKISSQGMHPVPDPSRDCNPNPPFGVAEYEVHRTDRLALNAVGQYARLASARHDLQPVRPKIRNQDVSIDSECEPVRQRARQVSRRFAVSVGEVSGDPLRDDLLRAIMPQPHHSAARVRRPQCSVLLRQDAFRPLQPLADKLEFLDVDSKVQDRIRHFLLLPAVRNLRSTILETIAYREISFARLAQARCAQVKLLDRITDSYAPEPSSLTLSISPILRAHWTTRAELPGVCSFRNRDAGAEIPTEPTIVRSATRMGAATQRTPSMNSASSNAYPRRRISAHSLARDGTEVIVVLVNFSSFFGPKSAFNACSSESVSRALPCAVAYNGTSSPA